MRVSRIGLPKAYTSDFSQFALSQDCCDKASKQQQLYPSKAEKSARNTYDECCINVIDFTVEAIWPGSPKSKVKNLLLLVILEKVEVKGHV